jgi:hypothetical protein
MSAITWEDFHDDFLEWRKKTEMATKAQEQQCQAERNRADALRNAPHICECGALLQPTEHRYIRERPHCKSVYRFSEDLAMWELDRYNPEIDAQLEKLRSRLKVNNPIPMRQA